jgi:glycosyltransferase involved in cell wall biosynthesis
MATLPCVIVNGQWMLEDLAREGLPRHRMHIVAPPIVPSRGTAKPEQHGSPIIIYTGRLVEFKGVDHVLRASAILRKEHRVWVVGHGPMRLPLELLAAELGIQDRVTFFGNLEDEALNSRRSQATVLVVPSLAPETFGLVGPEAMELALPVVAYDVGGISEWLHDEQNGLLVAPGDDVALAGAIERIISDPELARRMGETGRQATGQWHASLHAQKLISVYEQVMQAWADKTHPIVTAFSVSLGTIQISDYL